MDMMAMYQQMTWVAKLVAVILLIMSMWSIGVGIERFFTYTQARNQSKVYAPQVAKHLKEGRLKDAIALSTSKNYRYSHLAKVVLAGLQEYQFQQESGAGLGREDLMDTVRRSIQRASALTASDLKKGVSALATIGSRYCPATAQRENRMRRPAASISTGRGRTRSRYLPGPA